MPITAPLCILVLALLQGCGSEDDGSSKPARSPSESAPPTSKPATSTPEPTPSGSETSTSTSSTVLTLYIQGMSSESDAAAIRRELQKVSGVERADVDHAKGKAICVMEAGFDKSSRERALKAARAAVDDRYNIIGQGWKVESSESSSYERFFKKE